MDVTFPTYTEGIRLAINYNTQAITFEQEVLDRLDPGSPEFQLYMFLLLNDMAQQDLIGILYTHDLHGSDNT